MPETPIPQWSHLYSAIFYLLYLVEVTNKFTSDNIFIGLYLNLKIIIITNYY
ncbi:MAG: hypothetical protein CM1200mP1_04390 [Candidatus Neomarinimicrobiota bacterium]|nr:MAG: hypothetical protein CM1200mP1_04390 [Candidatus Neomarinimicrobiota bacterium]